jgi:hypothetical protein
MDVGAVNEVIVSVVVGIIENGAADVGVVTITRGTAAEEIAVVVGEGAALLETSVMGTDEPLSEAMVVEAVLVGPAGADEREPELVGAVVVVADVSVGVPLAEPLAEAPLVGVETGVETTSVPEADAVGVETTSVPESDAVDETGTTVRVSDPVNDTLALTEIGAVPEDGTTLTGVTLMRVASVPTDDTTGTMATEELTAVPTTLDTLDTTAGIKSVVVPVAAPVSPELSGDVAAAGVGVTEGAVETSVPEMMVDSPTIMPVGAALDETASVGVAAVDDGSKVVAGRRPVDPTTAGKMEEEAAGLAAGTIVGAAEEEAGSGDDAGMIVDGNPPVEARSVLARGVTDTAGTATAEDDAGITVSGTEPVDATTAIEDVGVVSTRGTAATLSAELDAWITEAGLAPVEAAGVEAAGVEAAADEAAAGTVASDAGTGVKVAVDIMTSVDVGLLAGIASGRGCTELETWTTVDAAGSNVSDVLGTTSETVEFGNCRLMCRGK